MSKIEALKRELEDTKLMLFTVLAMNQFKGGFLARASHELRAPLSSLIGLHQMILEGLCDSHEEELQWIANGKNYSFKLLDLLNQLIYVSQLDIGKFPLKLQAISVNNLLQEVDDLVRIYARNQSVKLEFHALEKDLNIYGDRNLIKQVLVILINTIISVLETGKIIVLTSLELSEKKIKINLNFPEQLNLFKEEINLLNQSLDQSIETNYQLIKNNLKNLDQLSFSPQFNLNIAQILLEKVGGNLNLNYTPEIKAKNKEENHTIQLQCLLPLMFDD